MLNIRERQTYLKYLGYYKLKVDGIEGKGTKEAYLKLQKDYFFNKKDKDGIYGKNTDILLVNAYRVKKYAPNFDLKKELRCSCKGKYCTGYPAYLNVVLLQNIQDVRNRYGSTKVTSGLRCKTKNDKTKGSSKTSRHLSGKAIDFQNSGTRTNTKRKETIDWIIEELPARYVYCNGYARTKTKTTYPKASNMGASIHMDVV